MLAKSIPNEEGKITSGNFSLKQNYVFLYILLITTTVFISYMKYDTHNKYEYNMKTM